MKPFAVILAATTTLAAHSAAPFPEGPTPAERQSLERDLAQLKSRLEALERKAVPGLRDQLPEAALYYKGAVWALTYEPKLVGPDLALVRRALTRGLERVAQLETGKTPWNDHRGRLPRAYRSRVDGSIQPYALTVPRRYDPRKPIRLDVVLHGSTRPVGLSELRFVMPFDEGDAPPKTAPDADYIELRPLGRVENCYRWAGETDVFEAIEDVCRDYNIDRDRIVLRGMSMGASGTWHLGLKHPDRFAALGPYCGYVDTHRFSLTPLPNFIKVGALPEHQETTLHMLDSVDYAANAGIVPAIAAMGEKDVFFDAHVIMGEAFRKEGLPFTNLISPGTGHVQDPVTFAEQMRRIGEHTAKGLDRTPRQLRFVTWTLKYPKAHWVELLGLEKHYQRAEVNARIEDNGSLILDEPKNVTRLALILPPSFGDSSHVKIGGDTLTVAERIAGQQQPIVFERRQGHWRVAGLRNRVELTGKRPGLQGPIDDAFTERFLCVRGTGKPWNPQVDAWAQANLKRFQYEWHRYFRGDLPIKNDTEVTEEDLRTANLILFGDPGSNPWIRKALPRLPVRWTQKEVRLGKHTYPAADHAPAFIQPNPLPGAKGRYLVINSGHTFHEKELASLNYLLFPRLGDWAVLKVDGKIPGSPSEPLVEAPVRAGFFDERWGL